MQHPAHYHLENYKRNPANYCGYFGLHPPFNNHVHHARRNQSSELSDGYYDHVPRPYDITGFVHNPTAPPITRDPFESQPQEGTNFDVAYSFSTARGHHDRVTEDANIGCARHSSIATNIIQDSSQYNSVAKKSYGEYEYASKCNTINPDVASTFASNRSHSTPNASGPEVSANESSIKVYPRMASSSTNGTSSDTPVGFGAVTPCLEDENKTKQLVEYDLIQRNSYGEHVSKSNDADVSSISTSGHQNGASMNRRLLEKVAAYNGRESKCSSNESSEQPFYSWMATSSDEGKRKRQSYSRTTTMALEAEYLLHQYISKDRRAELRQTVPLSDKQIKTWFQNRRMKDKKDAPTKQDSESVQLEHEIETPRVNNYVIGETSHLMPSPVYQYGRSAASLWQDHGKKFF